MRKLPPDLAERLLRGADDLPLAFADARMDDIAEASGIPRATLYYHFPSKIDVLRFLHDALLVEYRDTVRVDHQGSARDRLTTLFERLFDHVARHPGTAQLVVANVGQLGKLSELTTSTYDPLIERIEEVLHDGIRAGEVATIDVARTAVAMSAIVHVLATKALIAGELDGSSELAKWLVGMLWNGVSAHGDEAAHRRRGR